MKYKILTSPKIFEIEKTRIARIEKKFKELGLNYSISVGSIDRSVRDIAQGLAKNDYDAVICLGGDGTLHEVINGVYGKEIKLGIIPMGHGNDMARSLGIPRDVNKSINVINRGKSKEFYLGQIQNLKANKVEFFFSVVGLGFDVKVIEIVEENNYKKKYRTWAYNAGTLKALFSYRPLQIRAECDGKKIKTGAMMFSIGNSTTYGGGMKITPKANPQKNFFNITYLKQMNIITFLWHFPKVFSGRHINVIKHVKNFNAKKIQIDNYPRGKIIADGELLDMLPARIIKARYKQKIIIP